MAHVRDLLTEARPAAPTAWSTGFAILDELTGGFHPGEIWLVTGAPGHGCSTLLTQWAGRLAGQDAIPTWLLSPRDSAADCASRLLASLGAGPVRSVRESPRGTQTAEQVRAASALADAELFVGAGDQASLPALVEERGHAAVLVDDADLVASASPGRLMELADDGALVVAMVPRHLLVVEDPAAGDLGPHWARVAEVVLEVRTRGLDDGDAEIGTGEIAVLKYRHGPTTTLSVGFDAHYARFRELR